MMNRGLITVIVAIVVAIIAFYIGRMSSLNPPQTDFPGSDKQEITRDEAEKYVQNFRKQPQAPKTFGGIFYRPVLDKILAQQDCDGVRFYYAKSDDTTATLILVGIDKKGYDMKSGVYADKVPPCPPFCDPPH